MRHWSSADFIHVAHYGHLDCVGFVDFEFRHGCISSFAEATFA